VTPAWIEAGQAADTCGCEGGKTIPNEDNFRIYVLFWQGLGKKFNPIKEARFVLKMSVAYQLVLV
jgi:hypothetical protein